MATLHVDVVSAEANIFSGEAKFVALPGENGELGILPRHTNKRAGSLWKDWVKTADFDSHFDFYGLQNLIAQGLFESGEVLIRRHYDKSAAGVPLRLQVLEPDYLDSTKQGPLPGGNYAIAGVEINPQGQRVAYHLYRQHQLLLCMEWLELLHKFHTINPQHHHRHLHIHQHHRHRQQPTSK